MGLGDMRQIVIFGSVGKVPASSGGATDEMSPGPRVHGRIRKKRGGRNLSFGDIMGEEGWELKVRYSDAIKAMLKPNLRIVYLDEVFIVSSWTLVKEKKMYYLIDLTIDRKA
jgi:head-tail adaptor